MIGLLHRLLEWGGRPLVDALDSVGALSGIPPTSWQLDDLDDVACPDRDSSPMAPEVH